MSTVYEAVDTRLGRTVALKILSVPPYLSQAQREALQVRMMREARAIGSLSHPNVVTIYDVGEDKGRQYLVMEFLDGITLRQRLDASVISPAEVAGIFRQVCSGLDAVHAEGVVHRDLKPGNVLLLPDGRVKLLDFGVARQMDDTTVTQAGMMVGSPAYMAPEQVLGEIGTGASDIWSLGVLLFEMLTGKPPFTGDNIPAVLYQVAHGAPSVAPGMSANVRGVIERALSKEPNQRYQSALLLADDFERALAGGKPTPAPSPAASETVQKETPPTPIPSQTNWSTAATAAHSTGDAADPASAPADPDATTTPEMHKTESAATPNIFSSGYRFSPPDPLSDDPMVMPARIAVGTASGGDGASRPRLGLWVAPMLLVALVVGFWLLVKDKPTGTEAPTPDDAIVRPTSKRITSKRQTSSKPATPVSKASRSEPRD